MSKCFMIPTRPYDSSIKFYNKAKIEIQPGVTVLVGCNGSGKSTLMSLMMDQIGEEGLQYVKFDNEHDGGINAADAAGHRGDFELLATLVRSSEGEKIVINTGQHAVKCGRYTSKIRDAGEQKELWFFFDAVDSGMSIDNIIDIKEHLFDTILSSTKGLDTYIIVSANSYEMASGRNCFDVIHGKYINFENYEDYRTFILNTKQLKDKRYE